MAFARVTIKVIKFVNLLEAVATGATGCSKVSLHFSAPSGFGVKMFGPPGQENFMVWGVNREIRFEFDDKDYRPLGIYFRQVGSDQSDPAAQTNMTLRAPGLSGNKRFIKINAARIHADRDLGKFVWQLMIPFENVTTDEIGLVDPEICNSDVEQFPITGKKPKARRRSR